MGRDKTLVLGSGISALAYLYYDPDAFALAGDEVGGLFRQSADLGPQLVWVTASTARLLRDLGIEADRRRARVGYYYSGRLWAAEELAGAMQAVKIAYALKTRGGGLIKSSYMSSGKGSYDVFDVPVTVLVDSLLERVSMRLLRGKAVAVDLHNHIVRGSFPIGVTENRFERDYQYDKLVSTVPAPVFLNLAGLGEHAPKLVGYDKVYQKVLPDEGLWKFEAEAAEAGFDYVYVVDSPRSGEDGGFDFHRTRIVRGDGVVPSAVREYTLTPDLLEDLNGVLPTGKLQKRGQIVGGHEVLSQLPSNVELLGRYAEWRHDRRLEDVLEVVQ